MRPYYNYDDEPQRYRVSFASAQTSMGMLLIALNGLTYLILAVAQKGHPDVYRWVGFYSPYFFHRFAFWQPLSYMFVHAGLWHLFMNMIGLFFFAGPVERALGRRAFLLLYALCGIGGAALSLFQPDALLVGASGGVLGVLIAYAMLFPDEQIIFIIFPMRARYVAIVWAFVTVAGILTDDTSGTSHWAHLGGIVVAILFILSRPALRRVVEVVRYQRSKMEARRSAAEEAELDRVLDKVHREGITALSNSEREFLNLMSKRRR